MVCFEASFRHLKSRLILIIPDYFQSPMPPSTFLHVFFGSITGITTVTKFPAGSPTIVGCLHCIGSKVLATWHANSDFLSCPKGRVLPKARKRHLLFSRRRWRPAMRAACSTTQGTKSKRLVVCRFAPCEMIFAISLLSCRLVATLKTDAGKP